MHSTERGGCGPAATATAVASPKLQAGGCIISGEEETLAGLEIGNRWKLGNLIKNSLGYRNLEVAKNVLQKKVCREKSSELVFLSQCKLAVCCVAH